jgi:hypothetical protein
VKYPLITGTDTAHSSVVNLRCPHCRHKGAFHGLPNCPDVHWLTNLEGSLSRQGRVINFYAGCRKCPNPECQSLIFVVLKNGALDVSYPPEVIDFDSTNLPPRILATLEEAIKAHGAGCYVAAALMVRRLLEELCEDKAAAGDNLKARVASLAATVIVPQELLGAADELRLLGNDAAHIEAKAYDKIGKDEAALAIELAKELLKAVYQYASLVSKLRALKKPLA